jgi:hypothetical protein
MIICSPLIIGRGKGGLAALIAFVSALQKSLLISPDVANALVGDSRVIKQSFSRLSDGP